MDNQEELRKACKIFKALCDDIFTYKDLAEVINININSFYNWLNGYYQLSYGKAKELKNFIYNVLD